ncbi:hypothetical protein [Streptomyces leeuwenhoekii]|uniref:hypothetical protein n=1 Tax=Streptomyces leeuwenhoekii TaxID=1437453 RepID=UPI000A9E692A|nr:hypothetical protein [Streptomyces leeuwenhoekii]
MNRAERPAARHPRERRTHQPGPAPRGGTPRPGRTPKHHPTHQHHPSKEHRP